MSYSLWGGVFEEGSFGTMRGFKLRFGWDFRENLTVIGKSEVAGGGTWPEVRGGEKGFLPTSLPILLLENLLFSHVSQRLRGTVTRP